ncbi:hypothetical protein ACF06W_11770 [Streptomyces albus]|uniref:hypothetical protein n=1 Tax=Streptomyces albus TaxID=1888 RepID=UPI0036FDD29C
MPTDTNASDNTGLSVRTAFLVVQHENGEWEAVTDIRRPITPTRPPSVIEMKFGCSEVVSDIEASKQAAITAHQLMAVTAQMQQAAENQTIADRLKL